MINVEKTMEKKWIYQAYLLCSTSLEISLTGQISLRNILPRQRKGWGELFLFHCIYEMYFISSHLKGRWPFTLGMGTVIATTQIISSLTILSPHVLIKKKPFRRASYQKLLICQLCIIWGSFCMPLQAFETSWHICPQNSIYRCSFSGMCKVPGLTWLAQQALWNLAWSLYKISSKRKINIFYPLY